MITRGCGPITTRGEVKAIGVLGLVTNSTRCCPNIVTRGSSSKHCGPGGGDGGRGDGPGPGVKRAILGASPIASRPTGAEPRRGMAYNTIMVALLLPQRAYQLRLR